MIPGESGRSRDREPAEAEVLAALALRGVSGLGDRRIRREIESRGSARAAAARRGLDTGRHRAHLDEAHRRGLRVVSVGGDGYPVALLDLVDPPPVLFTGPRPWPDQTRSAAIVGTRRSSSNGNRVSYELARSLAYRGWTVVSGMAIGIDASAHEGSLDVDGDTIGVLGSGHAHEYPHANRALYARMRCGGLLVSEFPPCERPSRATFPRRNRLIAALSRVVIVVEAGERSGALITADHALDLGREVYAVPGRVGDAKAVGTLALLRQGATLVRHADDVLDSLGELYDFAPPPPAARPRPATADSLVLDALGVDELTADQVADRTELAVSRTVVLLGRLELEGLVSRRPGGRFSASGRTAPE